MNTNQLSAYVAKTRAYLATDRAREAERYMTGVLGYSYTRRLAAHVMTATRLVIYERIQAVVDELLLELTEPGEAA